MSNLMQILTKFYYKCRYKENLIMHDVRFRKGFMIRIDVKSGGVIKVGNGCFFNNYCSLNAHQEITIGENCIFGENVRIYDHNHCYKDRSKLIQNQGYSSAPILIEDGCWIGSNVTILKGSHIGKHCVIGAGAVILKDIPAYSVVYSQQNLIIKDL